MVPSQQSNLSQLRWLFTVHGAPMGIFGFSSFLKSVTEMLVIILNQYIAFGRMAIFAIVILLSQVLLNWIFQQWLSLPGS